MPEPKYKILDPDNIKLFTGNAHPRLAGDIAAHLGLRVSEAQVNVFRDGEINVEIGESVRGKDVYLIQPTCPDVNRNLMELLVMIDAAKRASAQAITAVIPYYGYARQDRKVSARAPITAKLVADLISAAGANRVMTVDLHAGQIQGFFNMPVDNMYAAQELADAFEDCVHCSVGDIVVVSPDAGGARRALYHSRLLRGDDTGLAVIVKQRPRPGEIARMILVGDVRGKTAILVDDIVDSAGTLAKAAQKLLEEGAKSIYACCSHPVLSGPAVENIEKSPIEKLIVTDTIPLTAEAAACKKIKVTSVSHLLAAGIWNIHHRDSISKLFPNVVN